MEFLATYAPNLLSGACTALGAAGGLWVAFSRIRHLLKLEIREYAASKEDVARIEGKIDLVVNALLLQRTARNRKALKQ